MARQRNELNRKEVEAWKHKNSGLSSNELVTCLIKAIQAIRKRSLVSLSSVTVTAVIDRILFECKEKFAVLSEITNDPEGLHFQKFINQIHDSKLEERQNALQELLVDLLDVFGKITADILTRYLHQELMNVTGEPEVKHSELRTTQALSSVKNREEK